MTSRLEMFQQENSMIPVYLVSADLKESYTCYNLQMLKSCLFAVFCFSEPEAEVIIDIMIDADSQDFPNKKGERIRIIKQLIDMEEFNKLSKNIT